MTTMTITGNMKSFLEGITPYRLGSNQNFFFSAAYVTQASSAKIVARSDELTSFGWVGVNEEEKVDFPTISLKGNFTYGKLGQVSGNVSSIAITFEGKNLVKLDGIKGDAQKIWGSLISDAVVDYLPALFKGSDKLNGAGTDDWLNGFRGNDKLDGGSGKDSLNGGSGNDTVFGQGGKDTLDGGSGRDKLDGGDGNDRLYGGSGNDTLLGKQGDDRLYSGSGDDKLVGGQGSDQFLFSYVRDQGDDTISDWVDGETIRIGGGIENLTIRQAGSDVEIFFLNNSVTVIDATVAEVSDDILA